MAETCWDILGIEPTRDDAEIRRAYARALRSRRPDEDADAFQHLVTARAQALAWHWPDEDADEEPDWDLAEDQASPGGVEIRLTSEDLLALSGDDGSGPDVEQDLHARLAALRDRGPDEPPVVRLTEDPAPFDPMPGPDLVADRQSSLRYVLDRLASLLGNATWDGPAWRDLMRSAVELDLAERSRLRQALVRNMLTALPPLPPYAEARADILADCGPAAAVDPVELEFALAQDQAKLAVTTSSAVAQRYLGWVVYARRDVPLARRTPGQARALTALDGLTEANRADRPRTPASWNVATWRDLLSTLGGLSSSEREACLGPLIGSLADTLPAEFDETVPVFLSGNSIAAVVEAVDQVLHLAGAGRASLPVGMALPPHYEPWLLAASRLRATMQRVAEAAYWDANGIPALPADDRDIWPHPRFDAYWELARRLGRWPVRFDWQAFVFPLSELQALGIGPVWATLLLALGLVAVSMAAGELNSPPAEHWVASAVVLSFLVLRLPAAFLYRSLAIRLAMRRVRRVDRDGLSAPGARTIKIRVPRWGRSRFRHTFEFALIMIALSATTEAVRPVDRERVAYESGLNLEARGKHAEAVAAFDRALRIDPQNSQASYSRALSVVDGGGDNQASEAALTSAIGLNPDNVFLLGRRAYLLYGEGRFIDAIADYDRAVAINPNNAEMLSNRGAVYAQSGNCPRAIADYTSALALSPDFVAPLRNRALCYGSAGQYDKAIVDQTAALAAMDGTDDVPTKAAIYVDRGWLHVEDGDYPMAVKDLQQAVSLAPSMQRARLDLGFAQYDSGAFKQAATELEASFQPKVTPYALIFWHLAHVRDGSADAAGLAAGAASLPATEWPYPVIEMFLGRQTPDAILAAAATDQQRCEANFYVGEWNVLQSKPGPATEQFERTLATCPRSYIEYHAADAELHGLRSTWP